MQAQQTGTPLARFPATDAGSVTTFETDELTALCPFEYGSGRDFYELTIRYEADEHAIESKSLRDWIRSFDNREITVEQLAAEIHATVARAIDPARLYVRLEQNRRGGIDTIEEVGDRGLGE